MAGYCHVGDSNVAQSLWMSDAAYDDEHMALSKRYDVKILNTGNRLHAGTDNAT